MKACPYCAEQIQDAAIKCRFCGSDLQSAPRAPGAHYPPPGTPAAPTIDPGARPNGGHAREVYTGTPSWKAWFWQYVGAGVLSVVLVGVVWWLVLEWRRKSIRYRITDRTIDVERGMVSRHIDTLQLWRVQDLEFRQSVLERLVGIARILVFTTDKTDPGLVLVGLPASREIFDILKDAVEEARQQRVIGLVQ